MNKVVDYIKNSVEEMKRVQWPSKNETLRLTGYVIGVSLGVALFVAIIDYLFKSGLASVVATK